MFTRKLRILLGGLSGKVAVLLTYEDPSRSTVRLCRVMNSGQRSRLQTMVSCWDATWFRHLACWRNPRAQRTQLARKVDRSFVRRPREGRWAGNQTDLLRGRPGSRSQNRQRVTPVGVSAHHRRGAERVSDVNIMTMTATNNVSRIEDGTVFTFSGQGSYSYSLLRDLYLSYPQTWPYFQQANGTSRRFLGSEFLPLVTATSQEEGDDRLKECPNLDQVGIYLGSVLTAQVLMQSGAKPSLLVGHSFGELAALRRQASTRLTPVCGSSASASSPCKRLLIRAGWRRCPAAMSVRGPASRSSDKTRSKYPCSIMRARPSCPERRRTSTGSLNCWRNKEYRRRS